MNTRIKWMAAIGAVLLAGAAPAKESGSTRVDVELMAAPYRDARVSGRLGADTRLEILERRGAWLHVAAAKNDGWLRLHQVRLGEGEGEKGSSGFLALWNVGTTGRSGTQGIVATTGIRGMSAEQLKDAEPNPKEFEKLDQFQVDDGQARQFAAAAGLKDRPVAALSKPE